MMSENPFTNTDFEYLQMLSVFDLKTIPDGSGVMMPEKVVNYIEELVNYSLYEPFSTLIDEAIGDVGEIDEAIDRPIMNDIFGINIYQCPDMKDFVFKYGKNPAQAWNEFLFQKLPILHLRYVNQCRPYDRHTPLPNLDELVSPEAYVSMFFLFVKEYRKQFKIYLKELKQRHSTFEKIMMDKKNPMAGEYKYSEIRGLIKSFLF